MEELTVVRQNLMDNINYRPYCGSLYKDNCYQPRTELRTDGQFICPNCKWISKYDDDFILRYKQKHNLKQIKL